MFLFATPSNILYFAEKIIDCKNFTYLLEKAHTGLYYIITNLLGPGINV